MALPKLNATHNYSLNIPSTGRRVMFRPYTVSDERGLLAGIEGGDANEIGDAIIGLVENCTELSRDDVDDLTSYDIEYIFLQLRMKSVSSDVEMEFRNNKCEQNDGNECLQAVRIKIDLNDVAGEVVKYKPSEASVVLGEGIGVKLKPAPFKRSLEITTNAANEKLTQDEANIRVIIASVDVVFDEDSVFDEFTSEEIDEFVNGMTVLQRNLCIDKIEEIQPKLKWETKFKCGRCGFEEDIKFEGLQDFFV